VLEPLCLRGQRLRLRERGVPLGRQRAELGLHMGDEPIDLAFVVAAQRDIERGLRGWARADREQFFAVRHAPILTRNIPPRPASRRE